MVARIFNDLWEKLELSKSILAKVVFTGLGLMSKDDEMFTKVHDAAPLNMAKLKTRRATLGLMAISTWCCLGLFACSISTLCFTHQLF